MKILSTAFIAGLPAREVQRVIRVLQEPHTTNALADRLDLSDGECSALIDSFGAEGLIELCREIPSASHLRFRVTDPLDVNQPSWITTVAGNALGKARIDAKQMSRSQAETLLATVLNNVTAINADEDLLFRIITIELFGSMLNPEIEFVTDIDLRVVYDRNIDPDDYVAEMVRRHPTRSILQSAVSAEKSLRRQITGGSKKVDIQLDESEPRRLPDGTETNVIFKAN